MVAFNLRKGAMTELNNKRVKQPSDNYSDDSDKERSPKHRLEDWEMVEQMYEPETGLKTWGVSVLASFVVGILVFVLLAFALYYFLFHYGDLFFASHPSN